MKTIGTNESSNPLKSYIRSNYFLYLGGEMIPLFLNNEQTAVVKSLHISLTVKSLRGVDYLSEITFKNKKNFSIPLKLYVENDLHLSDYHYGFASPVENVLFFTNNKGLFLMSGIFKDRSFNQYGVIQKGETCEKIVNGKIPFRPIACGNVIGLYSFEHRLEPFEVARAYTWMLMSKTMSEEELLKKDKQLKQILAFSREK
ncbi:hypothetical protein [Fervidibacillus halotolerans]|uniref:Uncharacterized protein n=1 Tax=Fervidibacillus halotolerans TaxID=2980027 RepID=A0A9E8LXX7_9BACI|nr:hypothetical protein [Fervidibacillus halotolerans]WAA11467.1 hypothetical protein OE105_07420 [Fervidibacillus halotolerans]